MIEISAKLFRGSVYFINEQLKCLVSYRNTGDTVERLAWSGAQIHCHSAMDETKVSIQNKKNKISEEEIAFSSKETSFHPCKGEKGSLVFSTKTKILFCDITLNPNECRTFLYEENIPSDCPPSYYGSWVKYMYKLTIGTQRVNCVIQLLRMPLRVITLVPDIWDPSDGIDGPVQEVVASPSSNNHVNDIQPVASSPSQPSSIDHTRETNLDLVLHQLDCLTGKRSLSSFVITGQSGKIARFYLLKNTFKLGEDIIGLFDFIDSTVPCVQFSVALQSEETLKKEFRTKSSKSSNVTTHSKYHDFCLHMNNAQIILPVPLTVTPAFETNLMILTWKLHFEFVNSKAEEVETLKIMDSHGVMEQGTAEVKVQTMVWDLPINVLPTHPLQIGRGLSMPATMSIVV